MQALNGGDLFKQTGYVLEALPFGQLSKGGVGGGELLQLAGCGEGQILGRAAQGEGVAGVNVDVFLRCRCMLLDHLQEFLTMNLFVVCRFLEDTGQVFLPFLPGNVGVNGIPVAGLGFTGESPGQVNAGF